MPTKKKPPVPKYKVLFCDENKKYYGVSGSGKVVTGYGSKLDVSKEIRDYNKVKDNVPNSSVFGGLVETVRSMSKKEPSNEGPPI